MARISRIGEIGGKRLPAILYEPAHAKEPRQTANLPIRCRPAFLLIRPIRNPIQLNPRPPSNSRQFAPFAADLLFAPFVPFVTFFGRLASIRLE